MSRGRGCLLALMFAGPACAQVSGSVTLLSDDRYHGVSRSDGQPSAQVALAWDGAGWYAGLQLSRVRFGYPGAGADLQAIPYLGYARRVRPGLSAEAGVQFTLFPSAPRHSEPELYFGLSGDRLRGRLSWTPHYYGPYAAWYGGADANLPLRGRLRAIAHAGVLQAQAHGEYDRRPGQWRYDFAAGLGLSLRHVDLQASWTTVAGAVRAGCGPWHCDSRNGWMLSVTRNW